MPGHNVLQDILGADMSIELPAVLAPFVVDRSPAYCDLVTTSSNEYRLLYDPTGAGQQIFFYFLTDGGDAKVLASSAIDASANTTITFDDAGDFCQLLSVNDGAGGYRWQVIAYTGVTFS